MGECSLKPQAKKFWKQLADARWFSKVGVPENEPVIVVTSWTTAIKSTTSVEWIDACNEAFNLLRESLYEQSKQRLAGWNTKVNQIRSIVSPVVTEKMKG